MKRKEMRFIRNHSIALCMIITVLCMTAGCGGGFAGTANDSLGTKDAKAQVVEEQGYIVVDGETIDLPLSEPRPIELSDQTLEVPKGISGIHVLEFFIDARETVKSKKDKAILDKYIKALGESGYYLPDTDKEDLIFPLENNFKVQLSGTSYFFEKGSTKEYFLEILGIAKNSLETGKLESTDTEGDLKLINEYIDYVNNM